MFEREEVREAAAIMIECAFAWKKCQWAHRDMQAGEHPLNCMGDCKGTGEVFALSEKVREDCRITPRLDVDCEGRGSVPTKDAWLWLEAVLLLHKHSLVGFCCGEPSIVFIGDEHGITHEANGKPREAFFEALSKALVAGGWTLG